VGSDSGSASPSPVTVWNDTCDAIDQGEEAAEWFSTHLGRAARLVKLADANARSITKEGARPTDRVSFADGFPFLLTSETSLEGLNRRRAAPRGMDRFRPNIVVRGCGEHAEDSWRRLRIGEVDFRVARPCARCVVITTDQQTARREPEPLRTLAAYRLDDGKVYFGQNLIHENLGTIAVGDRVAVVESVDSGR
jgi:uncharacterized protein YcbX